MISPLPLKDQWSLTGTKISLFRDLKTLCEGFPGGTEDTNPPANAGDTDSIPGQGTRSPHVEEQLSPCSKTTEPVHSRGSKPQLESLPAATKTQHNQINNK